jgi:two-component system, cell cycle sensor histidine kinase and response regulator CckA
MPGHPPGADGRARLASPRRTPPKEDRPPRAVDPRGLPADPRDAQAGAITHDVNNLLTAILGHAEIALSHADLPDPARSDVVEVVHAARQAALLTRQLIALRRPVLPDRAVIDLRSVAEAMAAMLRPLIGGGITLRTEAGPQPVWVEASPTDLEGIILNLAINARDAMPRGGTLTLSTAVQAGAGGRRAVLSVIDDGTGMDPHTRAHAFEPYFTTKGPGRGSGLGLTSVAAIVERSGWTILVESAPGEGSRFTVSAPLAPSGEQPKPARRAPGGDAPVAVAAVHRGDATR